MSMDAKLPENEKNQLPRESLELGRCIAALPEANAKILESAYNQVVEGVVRRRRILSLAQDTFSQLRLDIKYLMFDLNVTRSERDELREQLEDC